MIILHLCMRVSYIQYTTCNKIMEGKKRGCRTKHFCFDAAASFFHIKYDLFSNDNWIKKKGYTK